MNTQTTFTLDSALLDRARGCAVGAAVGDALGMPLEFKARRPVDDLVREMIACRLPAGSFTDDTEMALALAESLLAHRPFDADDLARRFVAWFRTHPPDVGNHTRGVLDRIAGGAAWEQAASAQQATTPDNAGNGSVMRCWPVALARWDDLDDLLAISRLQSRVTHPHDDCVAGCAFVNAAIFYLLRGTSPVEALRQAESVAGLSDDFTRVIQAAPTRQREELANSGWVRHTLESVVWGLLTTGSFEEALVQVVNLGRDADTAGTVVGALAGAAYGLAAIPARWKDALRGEWMPRSGTVYTAADFITLADGLASQGRSAP